MSWFPAGRWYRMALNGQATPLIPGALAPTDAPTGALDGGTPPAGTPTPGSTSGPIAAGGEQVGSGSNTGCDAPRA